MSTVVYIMVMFGYGINIVTGPEFTTQAKCEQAATIIAKSASDRLALGEVRRPWCVRIEK